MGQYRDHGVPDCDERACSSDRLNLMLVTGEKIHLHKKSIASLTERSENATAFSKLAEKDLRFSMKMVFEPVYETTEQPV